MVMKKGVFLLTFVLLLMPIIYAEDFKVSFTPVQNQIKAEEAAKFNLTISNSLERIEQFRVFTMDYPTWDIYTDPIQNPIIVEVQPKSEKTIILLVDPLKIYEIGAYNVNIKVESTTKGPAINTPVRVSIISSEAMTYIPTVTADLEIPGSIDPRENILIKVNLINQNILDIKDLVIRIESNLINDEITNEIGPKERKTVELTKQLDPLTSPQKGMLTLTLLKGQEMITGPIAKEFSIVEYASQSKETVTKQFLKTQKEIQFSSNDENYKGVMKVETNPLKSLFITTKPKSTIVKENGKTYLAWPVTLEDKLMAVKITENYRPLLYLAILIIILILLYLKFRGPLTIQKSVAGIEKREGGISNVNIILAIKNRGKTALKDIELMDRIPNLADIEKEISIGTLQPVKILKHEKKGSLVKWVLDNLDASEERVIRYRIKSKLSIIGGFNLPAAVAKYRHNNKETKSRSNKVTITSPSQS